MAQPWNLITTDTAAKQLGVTGQAVRRYYKSGILRGKRHGKYILVEQDSVIALMKVIDQARSGKKPVPPRRPVDLDDGEVDLGLDLEALPDGTIVGVPAPVYPPVSRES